MSEAGDRLRDSRKREARQFLADWQSRALDDRRYPDDLIEALAELTDKAKAAALREGARLVEPDEGGWCEAGCHDECRDRLRALADALSPQANDATEREQLEGKP